jgi:hypothetical protein
LIPKDASIQDKMGNHMKKAIKRKQEEEQAALVNKL